MERNFEVNRDAKLEHEKAPRLEIWLTRHANRTPTGELTNEGQEAASLKGRNLSSAEVVKGYSSRESTDRAYNTVQMISETSDTKAAHGGEYVTRRKRGLYYDIAGPLVTSRISKLTEEVNKAALAENPRYTSDDPQWSKLREKHQAAVLRKICNDPELSHIFAMGTAANFEATQRLGETYVSRRKSALENSAEDARPIQKDIVLNIGTHGAFIESFMRATLVREVAEGQTKRGFEVTVDGAGQVAFEQAMGDVIAPTESIRAVRPIDEKSDMLAVEFDNAERFKNERCSIDLTRVRFLAEQYKQQCQLLQQWEKKEINEAEFIEAVQKLRTDFEALR